MSNEKRVPGCLGYIGDHTTQLRWDYFINHEIRIPINQPTILESTAMSFSWLNWVFCSLTGGVGPYLMAHRLRRNPSRQRFLCKSMAPSAMDAIATSRAGMLLSLLPVPEKLGFEVVGFFCPDTQCIVYLPAKVYVRRPITQREADFFVQFPFAFFLDVVCKAVRPNVRRRYGMHCFGTYLHMSKPVITFVLKVLRNGLLRYMLYTCRNQW